MGELEGGRGSEGWAGTSELSPCPLTSSTQPRPQKDSRLPCPASTAKRHDQTLQHALAGPGGESASRVGIGSRISSTPRMYNVCHGLPICSLPLLSNSETLKVILDDTKPAITLMPLSHKTLYPLLFFPVHMLQFQH